MTVLGSVAPAGSAEPTAQASVADTPPMPSRPTSGRLRSDCTTIHALPFQCSTTGALPTGPVLTVPTAQAPFPGMNATPFSDVPPAKAGRAFHVPSLSTALYGASDPVAAMDSVPIIMTAPCGPDAMAPSDTGWPPWGGSVTHFHVLPFQCASSPEPFS